MPVSVKINCPISQAEERVYFVHNNGHLEPNGCDHASGSAVCVNCLEKAAEKLHKEQAPRPSSPGLSPVLNDPLSR